MINKYRENFIQVSYASLLLTLTLLLFGPLNLYFNNALEVPYQLNDIIYILIIFALIFFLLLTILLTVIGTKFNSTHKYIVSLTLVVGFLFWLQGNIMVWDYRVFDGKAIDWSAYLFNGILDTAVWFALIIFAIIKRSFVCKNLRTISISIIIIQAIYTSVIGINSPEQPVWKKYGISTESEFSFSKERNVIILVLDTFQTDAFQDIIGENPEYIENLDGFTYFKNSLGGFPTTAASVPLILTGQYYDNSIKYQDFIKKSYLGSSIPHMLKNNGYDVGLFPLIPPIIYYDDKVLSNLTFENLKYIEMVDEAKRLYDLAFFRYFPQFSKKYFYEAIIDENKGNADFESNTASDETHVLPDVEFINRAIKNSKLDSFNNTFKYYHLNGVHYPFTVNEELEYQELGNSYEDYKSEAKAALKIVKLFLETLKKINAYDNSMIFIVGDHGSGFYGVNRNNENKEGTNHISYASDNIIGSGIPLVLVKPFNSNTQMKISNAPVSLSDIPKTVADYLNLEVELPGKSMFKVQESEERARRFLSYTWEHEYWNKEYLPDMTEYYIDGFSWLSGSWEPTYKNYTPKGIKEKKPEIYQYGSKIVFGEKGNSQQYQINSWSGPETGFTWTDGLNASMLIPVKDGKNNLQLRIKVTPHLSQAVSPQKIDIYINNVKIGSLDIQESGEYNCIIPKEYIKDSLIELQFKLPNAFSPSSVGESSDERLLGLAFYELSMDKLEDYKYGSIIKFGEEGDSEKYKRNGWSSPENEFTWTDGERASLEIPIGTVDSDLELKVDAYPFLSSRISRQQVIINVNGEKLGEWEINAAKSLFIQIPKEKVPGSILKLDFILPNASSPKDEGMSDDARCLGIAVKSVEIRKR